MAGMPVQSESIAASFGALSDQAHTAFAFAQGYSVADDLAREMVDRMSGLTRNRYDEALSEIESVRRRDLAREMRDSMFLHRPKIEYRPAVDIQLPNYAEEKIKSIEIAENERRENLPVGQSLTMHVIVGGMKFLVSGVEAFTAKDRENLEIEVFDGETFQTVVLNYQHIVLLFGYVDVLNTGTELVH
jgi:hypothetical protein